MVLFQSSFIIGIIFGPYFIYIEIYIPMQIFIELIQMAKINVHELLKILF